MSRSCCPTPTALNAAKWRELNEGWKRCRRPGLVAASSDEAVPLHHAKMLHDGITGSWLIIIDGADHALIWARPDELVRVIDEFLGA
jgi:pimeloyl-ACP methyl ester carboxylesterase